MTSLKVGAVGWLVTAGAVAAWQAVISVFAEFLGLYGLAAVMAALATIVTSFGVLGVAMVRAGRWVGRAKRAVTTILGLDEKFDEHRRESRAHWKVTSERLDGTDDRVGRIESTLDALALAERAAVRGALEATRSPRSPRATDPGVRDGWRE